MRTKTLLLTAACIAAGLATSLAQSNVYSLNVVGYVNVSIPQGFSMVANQLLGTNIHVADLLPAPPQGTQVLKWTGAGFAISEYDTSLGWDSDATFDPGGGVFVKNPTATPLVITFVGEVAEGTNSNTQIPAGFSIRSSIVPVAGDIINTMSYPTALSQGDQILKWTGSGYTIAEYDTSLGWDSNPSVAIGEAFFVKSGAAVAWNRNFTVPRP